jgi:hypothetical protein
MRQAVTKHGRYSERARAERDQYRSLLQQCRETLAAQRSKMAGDGLGDSLVIASPRGFVVAQIRGIAGMRPGEIVFELNRGGRFVVYRYCFSAAVVTVMDSTDVYLIRANQSRIIKGLPRTLLTLVAGWWGVPWGPIRTAQSLWINFHGGTDVTAEIADALQLTGVKWDALAAH